MDNLKSSFMKVIGKGPNAQLVFEATDELLLNPNWEKNMAVCDAVNNKLEVAKEVVVALKKRAAHSLSQVQFLTLVLLEALVKNGGKKFHAELAACDGFRDELIKIAQRTGGMQELTARDYAKKILVNLRAFQKGSQRVQALGKWGAAAADKGVDFTDVVAEDWTQQVGLGSNRVANDPRNYHEEAAQQPRQPQQQQQHPGAPPQGPPPPAAGGMPAQPMIVMGPDGQRMLVQPLAPTAHVPGAVQAPPHVQQQVQTQLSRAQQLQHQQHVQYQQAQRSRAQHPQQQQRRHADPAQMQQMQEQEEQKLKQELASVLDQVALMRELLDAAAAENRAPADIVADEFIAQLADKLRSEQGRVSHVVSTGGGGDSLALFLQYNDSLIEILGRYSSMSGAVGIPKDNSVLRPEDVQRQQAQPSQAQQQQQQQPQAPQGDVVQADDQQIREQQALLEQIQRENAIRQQQQQQQEQAQAQAQAQAQLPEVQPVEAEDDFAALARDRDMAQPAPTVSAAEASVLDDLFAVDPAQPQPQPVAQHQQHPFVPPAAEAQPAAPFGQAPVQVPPQPQEPVAPVQAVQPNPFTEPVAQPEFPTESTGTAVFAPAEQPEQPAAPVEAAPAAPAPEAATDADFDSFLNDKLQPVA